ncbi:MAG TPA: aminodeoxychorismate synthase component I [Aldersonia sp.]
MRMLLIDNYDSFTYNLFQLLAMVDGAEPVVLHNDDTAGLARLDLDDIAAVVISPGPGRPDDPRDFGVSARLIRESPLPLLGVCLGHQGIVVDAGGTVGAAPDARHGYLDRLRHTGTDLFAGVPQDATVVRYHSLCAREPLPASLEITARSSDDVVMAVRRIDRPQWGVQFHPESVAGEHGVAILANFTALAARRRTRRPAPTTPPRTIPPDPEPTFRVQWCAVDRAVDAEAAFEALFADAPHSFWLDSEFVEPGLDRFSFLGDGSGPLAHVVGYDVATNTLRVSDRDGETVRPGSIFEHLCAQLAARRVCAQELPFDFTGGYVGYFGYELKADCGSPNRHRSDLPDAQWLFADRLLAVDHVAGRTYLLAVDDGTAHLATAATHWLDATLPVLDTMATWSNPCPLDIAADHEAVAAALRRGRDRYLADIAYSRAQLRAGQSYEICLTDNLRLPADGSGLDLYRTLRRCNPAPYAAYLRLGHVEIACASPERFLKITRDRTVESKPIKGTAPRGATPAEDERLRAALASDPKTRAENLMIVDLLRNDLGRVCEVGSVHVPSLMATETYSTVHQLVSTVRGTLRPAVDVIDCVRACFPGGSMTGAPKLRTLEILDRLEDEARGVYSGAIGFLGLTGTADLNIVIRTAVLADGEWRIGAGGAIVLDSDPEDEFHETVLKAAATARAHPAARG